MHLFKVSYIAFKLYIVSNLAFPGNQTHDLGHAHIKFEHMHNNNPINPIPEYTILFSFSISLVGIPIVQTALSFVQPTPRSWVWFLNNAWTTLNAF